MAPRKANPSLPAHGGRRCGTHWANPSRPPITRVETTDINATRVFVATTSEEVTARIEEIEDKAWTIHKRTLTEVIDEAFS